MASNATFIGCESVAIIILKWFYSNILHDMIQLIHPYQIPHQMASIASMEFRRCMSNDIIFGGKASQLIVTDLWVACLVFILAGQSPTGQKTRARLWRRLILTL